MSLKRAIVLGAALLLLGQAAAFGQEREPLAMQVEFEWTVIGTVSGAVIGGLIWLTDPANPHNVFSDSISSGAAWGAIIGAGFGMYVLQRTAQFPAGMVANPVDTPQIASDPVGEAERRRDLLHAAYGGQSAHGLVVPVLNLRF